MWTLIYHHEVESDLKMLGYAEARRVLRAIDARLLKGEPHKTGKPLSGDLANYRRLRAGSTRIVYKINQKEIEIFIIAVGARRDDIVYQITKKRAS